MYTLFAGRSFIAATPGTTDLEPKATGNSICIK